MEWIRQHTTSLHLSKNLYSSLEIVIVFCFTFFMIQPFLELLHFLLHPFDLILKKEDVLDAILLFFRVNLFS